MSDKTDEVNRYKKLGETQESAEVLASFRGFINKENIKMKYLKRDEILSCDDLKTLEVSVPEWAGTVVVKAMTGQERDAFEASIVEMKGSTQSYKFENIRAKLVAKTVIDPETKEPMFTVGDIEALGKKSAAALDRIFAVSQRLSKITEKDVEELIKN